MARLYSGYLKGLAIAVEDESRELAHQDVEMLNKASEMLDDMYFKLNPESPIIDITKNPEKMSERELRAEVKRWRA
jgi:hypothetical protein